MDSAEEIPRDLASLKRPALQKLCKKFGIKANGKNVDMIKALEELKDSTNLVVNNTQSPSQLHDEPTLSTKTDVPPENPPLISSTEISECQDLLPSGESKGESISRKGCGLEKISNNSLNQQSMLLGSGDTPLSLSGVSDESSGAWLTLSTESQYLFKPHSSCSCENAEMSPAQGGCNNLQNASSQSSVPISKHAQHTSPSQLCESIHQVVDADSNFPVRDEHASLTPFSPPLNEVSSNSKRKRKSTYTLETHNEYKQADLDVEQPPPKKVRRATFSVSPKGLIKCENASDADQEKDSNTKLVPESDDNQVLSGIVDIHSEIMDLLDKRVEEKLADPNYKPVFSANESLSSKSPPKSATAKKFDSAHKKHFARMQSIVSYQHDKDRRSATKRHRDTLHIAKRPKLTQKQSTQASRIPKTTFRPPALDVKHASFKFMDQNEVAGTKTQNSANENFGDNKSRKSIAVTKTPGKSGGIVSKTLSNTFVFMAKTATSAKKSQFNVKESLKKRPSYKPHTGKLPDFKVSRY